MLEKLSLENFKKHTKLDLDIPKGLLTITGENAAGKSTILKGIMFALFGATAAGAKDHLWRWGVSDKRSVGLALTLPEHGRVIISRTPSSAAVKSEDGRLLASGTTAVNQLIESSLGMLARDLRVLCYSPQGESQGLLSMGPAALQQRVEGLAQMEVVDKVIGRITQDVSHLEGQLLAYQNNEDPGLLQAKIENVKQGIEHYTQEIASQTQHYSTVKQSLDQLIGQYNTAKSEYTAYQSLLSTREAAQKRYKDAQQELANLGEFEWEANISLSAEYLLNLQEIVNQKTQNVVELDRQISQITSWIARAETLKQSIQKLDAQIVINEAAQNRVDALSVEFAEAQEAEAAVRSDVAFIQSRIDVLRSAVNEAVCPTCKRAMDGVNDLSKLRGELAKREAEWVDGRAVLAQHTEKLKVLSAKISAEKANIYPAAKDVRSSHIAALTQMSEEGFVEGMDPTELAMRRDLLKSEVADDTETLSSLRSEFNRREDLRNRITASKAKVEAEKQLLAEYDSQVAQQTSPTVEELNAAYHKILEETDQVNNSYALLSQLQQSKASGEMELKGLQNTYDAAVVAEKARTTAEADKARREKLQKYLRTNRTRLASDIWDGLLQYASALVSHTTSGVLSQVGRSDSGEFLVTENGRDIPVSESSGAQRSIVGLALRIAMTKVFYGDSLPLLLDEVSADASDQTAAAIAGMLRSLNMQVVTVTHRREGDAVIADEIIEIGG